MIHTVDLSDADRHLVIVRACEREWRGFSLPMATPEGSRYPYVYPRDLAAITRAMDRLSIETDGVHDFSHPMEAAARFLLAAQGAEGLWGQRYDLDAVDCSIYLQEDNTAHAIATLARHVRYERRRGTRSPIEDAAIEAIERGLAAARTLVYRRGINLFYSTTSIHESTMERGYTLWTNGAYRDGLRLSGEAALAAQRTELADSWSARLARLDENIRRHFVQDGQWIRRLTPEGRFDRRPDVTLLSPFYFGFEHLDPEASEKSAQRVENELWDPDLGLLQRYLPFREDNAVHLHAGNGPWLAYSLWLAQRHAAHNRPARARELMHLVTDFATDKGELPEHVSTHERFIDFMQNEWETGLDFRKEFDPSILLSRVGFSEILEEANRMRDAYRESEAAGARAGDGVIRFAAPLAWCHAEMVVAIWLLHKAEEKSRVGSPKARSK